jgi:hypothetical protein
MAFLKGRGGLMLGLIAIISVLVLYAYLPMYRYIPPGNPPVNPPEFGLFDTRFSQNNRTIQATDQVIDFDTTTFYYSFPTNGDKICLYGNFTSDRPVRFIITDWTGLQNYRDDGILDRYRIYIPDVHQHDWEIVIDPWLDGESVESWYVIISAFNYFYWEYDRHVSYFICEDKSPPNVELFVPTISNSTVKLYPRAFDLHCDIVSLRILINGTEVFQVSPDQREYYGEFTWDTTDYENGTYFVEVYTQDEAGNSYTYRWWTTVDNQPPIVAQENQIEIIVRVGGIISGSLATIVIIWSRKRRDETGFIIASVFVMLSVISVTTTVTEPIPEWGPIDSFQVIAACCSIISLALYMIEKIVGYYKRRPPRLKGDPSYIG